MGVSFFAGGTVLMAAHTGKIIGFSLAALLTLLVAAALLLLTAPVQTAIARRVLAGLNRDIAGEIRVGRVRAAPRGVIVLRDVALLDETGQVVASFDSLRAVVDVAPLRRSFAHVRSLHIENLQLNVALDSAGGSNMERALATKAVPAAVESGPSRWVIELDTVSIRGGKARVRDPRAVLFETESWRMRAAASFGHDSLRYDADVAAQCGLRALARGSAVVGDPIRSADGRLEVTLDSLFTATLPAPANVAGHVKATVNYATEDDSLSAIADVRSTTLGQVRADLTIPFPLSAPAGRASLILDHVRPGPIVGDTTRIFINGRVDVTKRETPEVTDGWDARVELCDSRYDRFSIPAAYLNVSVRDSVVNGAGHVNTGHGGLQWDAELRGFDLPNARLRADVRCDHLYLHALLPQVPDSLSPLTGALRADITSLDPDCARGTIRAQLARTSFGALTVDSLMIRAQVESPAFSLDTVWAALGKSELTVSAQGARGGELGYAVHVVCPDVADLADLLPLPASDDTLGGSLAISVTGRADLAGDSISHVSASGDVRLYDLQVGRYRVERAALRVTEADLDSLRFRAVLDVRNAGDGEQRVDSLVVITHGTPDDVYGSVRLSAKSDTLRLNADARVRREAERTEITLQSLQAEAYGVPWRLAGPTGLTLLGSRVDVDALTLESPLGVVRAAGTLDTKGEQDLALELSGLETADIARLLALPLPSATVNARVQVTGSDTALAGDFEVSADTVMLDGSALADEVRLFGTVDAHRVAVSGMVRWLGDTLTVFSGEAPARVSVERGLVLYDSLPIGGHVRIMEQPLEKLNRYLPFGMAIGGFASGEITISGTRSAPQWLGDIEVRDGTYNDSRTGIRYEKINLQGTLAADTLRISQVDVHSEGTLRGSGWAVMALPLPSELHLELNLEDFEAINGPIMQARASGNVTVNGPPSRLTGQGDLKVSSALYRITQSASKQIEEIDLQAELARLRGDTTKTAFLLSQLYRPMSHELFLEVPGNCWVRGGGVNIELSGSLWLYKDPDADPTINGQIRVARGDVQFLGRELRVDEGSVKFEGPITDPTLDITATLPRPPAQVKEITAHMTGPLTRTQVDVVGKWSDGREMTTDEILFALVGSMNLLRTDTVTAASKVQNALTTAASGQISGLVGQWTGLDVFEFRPGAGGLSDLSSGSLEVGTYVTDRLFVRVLQPIQATQVGQEVSVEYRVLDWLKLRAQQTGRESSALDILFQIDWR